MLPIILIKTLSGLILYIMQAVILQSLGFCNDIIQVVYRGIQKVSKTTSFLPNFIKVVIFHSCVEGLLIDNIKLRSLMLHNIPHVQV